MKAVSSSPVKKDLDVKQQRPQHQSELLDSSNEQEKENIQQFSTPQPTIANNKVVSIGLSKTVLNTNRSINAMNNNNNAKFNASFKQKKERELLQESNDSNTAFEDTEDDDADDIFVILEDNN